MNLIDCSYFYAGPLQIENARPTDDLDNNACAVQECVTAYIVRYQDEFLRKMLGKTLASQVSEYLAGFDEYAWDTDDRIEELCSRLRPSFAHYVYYKLAGDANQNMTVTGLVLLKSANLPQSPRQRTARVWNDMVKLNRDFVEWAKGSDFEVFYSVEMTQPVNPLNL